MNDWLASVPSVAVLFSSSLSISVDLSLLVEPFCRALLLSLLVLVLLNGNEVAFGRSLIKSIECCRDCLTTTSIAKPKYEPLVDLYDSPHEIELLYHRAAGQLLKPDWNEALDDQCGAQ